MVVAPLVGQTDATVSPRMLWQTDLAAARARAGDDDKPLLAVFRCET